MPDDWCPANGLARAEWFVRQAAEFEDAGNLDRAAYCRSVAASIEEREFSGRPLCALMARLKG